MGSPAPRRAVSTSRRRVVGPGKRRVHHRTVPHGRDNVRRPRTVRLAREQLEHECGGERTQENRSALSGALAHGSTRARRSPGPPHHRLIAVESRPPGPVIRLRTLTLASTPRPPCLRPRRPSPAMVVCTGSPVPWAKCGSVRPWLGIDTWLRVTLLHGWHHPGGVCVRSLAVCAGCNTGGRRWLPGGSQWTTIARPLSRRPRCRL